MGPFESKVLYTLQFRRGTRSPLNTPLYITLTMILCENMKPIEHVLLIRYAYFFTWYAHVACKHCNVKASVYYRTHWSCWWVYHFKKHRFHAIFIIKPRHTGRLIKQIWVEKPLVGAPVTCGKTPATVTWSENLKIYCRVYCYAIKTKSNNNPLAGFATCLCKQRIEHRTWANCALALSVSGASRSRLCPDGPRVHLSGPAYMLSCRGARRNFLRGGWNFEKNILLSLKYRLPYLL